MARVVHLSSVHSAIDNRVFYKQCMSLASAGHDVILIAQHRGNETLGGVRIVAINRPRNRIVRILCVVPYLIFAAMRERPDIVHFHDPELIPIGMFLRLLGIPTIYDVHEDYVTSIRDKQYLGLLRFPVAWIVALSEWVARHVSHVVIAEKSYAVRFPQHTEVLNYPAHQDRLRRQRYESGSARFLFTGGIHRQRGAINHANLVNLNSEIEVHLVGRIDARTRCEIIKCADNNADRLKIDGTESLVPFTHIVERYEEGNWTAGLALFPPSEDHEGKELTKFFEYMAAGIPILCSDFPLWRRLVEDTGCGICVDPDDHRATQKAIQHLLRDEQLVRSIGARGFEESKKYTWASQFHNLNNLYDRILVK